MCLYHCDVFSNKTFFKTNKEEKECEKKGNNGKNVASISVFWTACFEQACWPFCSFITSLPCLAVYEVYLKTNCPFSKQRIFK